MKKLLIYVPGLGPKKLVDRQKAILSRWQNQQTTIIVLDPKWHNLSSENCQKKQDRLLKQIKQHQTGPASVCIFGSSAGGSLALNLFSQLSDSIDACVLVSSKLKRPKFIGKPYRKRAPALYDCVAESERLIEALTKAQRQNILTIKPMLDETVSINDMTIEGAKNKTLPIIGHFFGIGYFLLFKKRLVINWLENCSKKTA